MNRIRAALAAAITLIAFLLPSSVYALTRDAMTALIVKYAALYNVSSAHLIDTAECESTFNESSIGLQGERGIFQFHPQGLWSEIPLGKRGVALTTSTTEQQIEMAAWAWSEGLSSHWSCA